MRKHLHRLLAIVFLLTGLLAQAQSEAEKTLLKSATKQFEAGEFLVALPAYSQLLSIAPDNKDYNFKFGTCLLASDEDVDRSIKHLKYACSDDSFEDARAYFYLAKALHLNYQFAGALTTYERFKANADSKTLNRFPEVDRLISMAENGKALMSDIKDIKVLDKTESTTGDFFRNYDMSEMGGSVIKVPEDLLSSIDKKKDHSPVMFFPEGGGEIIFSSYGSADHLDLYSVQRTADGGFSKPEKLAGVVNSPFDEDFPFLHADGRTLYFSSKGHNSMGGYDVFKSKRDLSTGLFETPVNLDFAISSPDDDIFYVVDRDKRIANFASDRNSESGRLHVYKVAVSNASLEMAIIQGKLINTTGGNNIARIRVLDANTDEEIGVYTTDEEGNYLIDLPGMGKYKFFVEGEESQVLHTGLVDVPSFGKIKAFKQEMILSQEAAQEKLVIKNQFDEVADIDVMALIQEVVKQKAQLDINFEGEPEVLQETETEEVLSEAQLVSRAGFPEDVSVASVQAIGVKQTQELVDRLDAEQLERDKAYARTVEWTERSEEMMAEAEQLFQATQSATSPDAKEELILRTTVKRAQAEDARKKAAVSLLLAKEVDDIVIEKSMVVNTLNQRNLELISAIESGEQTVVVSKLEEIKLYEDKAIVQADALDAMNKRAIDTSRDAAKIIGRVEEIRKIRRAAKSDITTKETQLLKSKKQKEKDILEAELTSLRAEVADMDMQLKRSATRMESAQIDADESTGAVQLLEQMRVGQMAELVALEPLAIPEGGLLDTERRLGEVRSMSLGITISTEDLDRIVKTRPELLTSLSAEEKGLLTLVSESGIDDELPGSSDITESIEEIAPQNTEIAYETEATTVIEEDQTNASIKEASTEVDELQEELAVTSGSLEDADTSTSGLEEAQPELDVEEEDIAKAAETGQPDYSSLSTDDLLDQLQVDYQSARDEIDASDMASIEKSKAKIDLNRAAVQVIDQKILDLKSSENFASNELNKSNAVTLQELSNELEYEMLEIAYQSETPIYPDPLAQSELDPESDEENTVEQETDGVENSEAATEIESNEIIDLAILEDIEEPALVALLNLHTEVNALESTIDAIANDRGRSDIVQTASRIKARGDFIEDVKKIISKREIDTEGEQKAMEMLIARQHDKMSDDIKIWQVQSGSELDLAEIVMSKNNVEYITRRTILESSDDKAAIDSLNVETSQKVLTDTDGLSLQGIDLITVDERLALMALVPSEDVTSAVSNEVNDAIDGEEVEVGSYELIYFKLASIAEDRTWIPNLIKDKDVRQQVMGIREDMSLLPVYGVTDSDKIKQHIKLNNDLAVQLNRELLVKEEEYRKLSKGKEVPAEVTDLLEESYVLTSRADEIRDFSAVNPDQLTNAEMLTKATQLKLKAMDKLEKAKELQVHLSKGRDRAAFVYQEAVEIDAGPLMNESAELLGAYTESTDLSSSEDDEVEEGADGSYELIYFKLATIAEDRTWIPHLIKDKDVRQNVMGIREEMSLLPVYGVSDADRVIQHIKLNNDLAIHLEREMLIKEEEFRRVSKRNEVPAEVTDLLEEAYALTSRADEIRDFSSINPDQMMNAEMLTKATQLELKAMDKLEKAQELQVHLSKGRDRTSFAYQDAIVIDTGLLMNESAEYLDPDTDSIELATASTPSTEEQKVSSSDAVVGEPSSSNPEEEEDILAEELSTIADTKEPENTIEPIDLQEGTETLVDPTDIDRSLTALSPEQQRLAADAVVTDISQIKELKKIEPTEAMRDYPEVTADLSEQDILPILSFEELTSRYANEAADLEYAGDWDLTQAEPEQWAALERKGIAVSKQQRYQASLNESIANYKDARQKRSVRLAEVIDEIGTDDSRPELSQEAQRLTKEIQIIDGYSRQAELNLSNNEMKLQALAVERETIVEEIENTLAETTPDALLQDDLLSKDDEAIAEVTPVQEEFNTATDQIDPENLEEKAVDTAAVEEALAEETALKEPSVVIFEVDAPDRTSENASSTSATPEESSYTEVTSDEPSNEAVTPELPGLRAAAADYENFVMPEVLVNDYFKLSAANSTRTRSITIDGDMPDGTVYQVQVGAFRNPIPEAHFSEFDPIMGKRMANGITRYKVGLFQNEATAIVARNQIRALGYSDAFVVKYIDGSREGIIDGVAIAEASTGNTTPVSSDVTPSDTNTSTAIETGGNRTNETSTEESSDVTTAPSIDTDNQGTSARGTDAQETATTTDTGTQVTIPAVSTRPAADPTLDGARSARPLREYDSDNTTYYEEAINAAPATQVERIEGLFYTVQVGVYSKPVTLASLYNISPLNSDLTPTGYIRYTSGIFDDQAIAEQWKKKLQARGVQDAFVTAYYNGNRITITKSKEILSAQGRGVLVAVDELNSLDSDRQGQAVWEMVSTSDLFSAEVEDKIDFKIRMGPYYERIPDKDVKVILDFENNVDYGKLDDGAIVYTTKGRMSYALAQEWRKRFLDLGISNANIIALKDGVEIPVKQALDFLLK